MSFEVVDGGLNSLIDFDLFHTWIALDIKNAIARKQIVVKFLSAADVENGIGRFIKLTNRF